MNCITKKNKIDYISIIIFLLISFFPINSNGQDNTMFYHMNNMPQNYTINPAKVNYNTKIILAIPILPQFNMGIHSTFSMKDIAQNENNTLIIDFDKIINTLPEKNVLIQTFQIPLLMSQYRYNDKIFSLSVNENTLMKLQFDREFVNFLNKGNAAYIGKNFSTGFDASLMHYRSYSFGYTQKVIENLTIGGRLNIYTGLASFDVANNQISLFTNEDIESIKLSAKGDYNMSLPVSFVKNSVGIVEPSLIDNFSFGDYMLNFSNIGLGLDLGANYKITPAIEVSASIIDLGRINWKSNTTNLKHDGSFEWKGLNFSNSINEQTEDYVPFSEKIENISDSIMNLIDFDVNNDCFTTGIPTKVYIGGKYIFNDIYSVGIVDKIYFYDENILNALTISGNAMFGKVFSLSASYSIIGNSFANFGIGTSLNLGPVNLFFVTDNILALFSPTNAKHMNNSFGMAFMFGEK